MMAFIAKTTINYGKPVTGFELSVIIKYINFNFRKRAKLIQKSEPKSK